MKSNVLSSTSFQLDKTFWGVGSATVWVKLTVALENSNFGPEADPRSHTIKKKRGGLDFEYSSILMRANIIDVTLLVAHPVF